MCDAGAVLVDATPDPELVEIIRKRLEVDTDRVADLHLWRVGPGHYAAVLTVVSDSPQAPSFYKGQLTDLSTLSHVTVEVEKCTGH